MPIRQARPALSSSSIFLGDVERTLEHDLLEWHAEPALAGAG